MVGIWLGISNLCAQSRGIPDRGLSFSQKSGPFHKKGIFKCLYDEASLFILKKARLAGPATHY